MLFPCIIFSLVIVFLLYVIVNAQVKHIYELTPTQARELRKLVENIDKDYIVSAGHKETISF